MSLLSESKKTIDLSVFDVSENIQAQDIQTQTLESVDILATTTVSEFIESYGIQSVLVQTYGLQVDPQAGMTNGFLMSSDGDGIAVWKKPSYGYSVGDSTVTIGAGALISFNIDSDTFPNYGFTSNPGVDGTTYTIASAGVYEFSFSANATNGNGDNLAIEVGLSINGNVNSPFTYRSPLANNDPGELWCRGSGLVRLSAGDVIGIKNLTNSAGTAIVFNAAPAIGYTCANRSLMLKQLDF